jgi:hypothetical protein
MLSTLTVEKIIEHIPPELQDFILELRNIVATFAPLAAEKSSNKGFIIYDARRGVPVSAGFCQILIIQEHFELAFFIHGAYLPDPKGLLTGERRYKKIVRIITFATEPWADLKDLITASVHFDPRSHQIM